jgi:CBS domain-containing protein
MLPPKEFLKKIQPFSSMSEDELGTIVSGLEVVYFKKDSIIYEQGQAGLPVYLIFSGLVCLYRNEEIVDYASRGELFGISAALGNTRSPLGARALEDSICYTLYRDTFRAVLDKNPTVADFFKTFLSRKFRSFSDLMRKPEIVEEGLFAVEVGQLVVKQPVTCPADATVGYAAETMDVNRVGSILAVSDSGDPLGILTSKDLRRVLVSGSRNDPVSRFMSSPVTTTEADRTLLDAYNAMMDAEIDHLVVMDGAAIRGVVTSKDILTQLAPSSSILTFYRKILKAGNVGELKAAFSAIKMAVAGMSLRNLRFYELARIITSVNDAVVKEALHFAGQEHAPGDFLWFHMGSSGRKEQIIATDQDSAIVCRAAPPKAFAEMVCDILDEVGIPKCTAAYMASNERWNVGLEVWRGYFKDWFTEPVPEHLRYLSVFLDIRPIYGDMELYQELLKAAREFITNQSIRFLAYDATNVRIPIGIFGIKNLDRGVNLKESGIYPIANGIRVMALEKGILEIVNTRDRMDALHAMGALGDEMRSDLLECYEFLQGLRVRQQCKAVTDRKPAGNQVTVADLDKMDLLVLKESLKIVASFMGFLKSRYGVERGL